VPGSPIGLGFGEGFSTVRSAELQIGKGQLGNKQLGVVATFAGANFDDAFHVMILMS